MTAVQKDPILTAAASAYRDPPGIRAAMLSYGEILGWPAIGYGPFQTKEGKEAWSQAVIRTQPLFLGAAWQMIETAERRRQRDNDGRKEETKVPVLDWKEAQILEPGAYPAIVDAIEEEEGQYGPQLRFQFIILGDEGERTETQIRGWCSAKWGAKTKLLEWSKVLLGKKSPGVGEPIDTDRLLKKKCDLVVEEATGQNGQTRAKVAALYPYRSMTAEPEDDSDDVSLTK